MTTTHDGTCEIVTMGPAVWYRRYDNSLTIQGVAALIRSLRLVDGFFCGCRYRALGSEVDEELRGIMWRKIYEQLGIWEREYRDVRRQWGNGNVIWVDFRNRVRIRED